MGQTPSSTPHSHRQEPRLAVCASGPARASQLGQRYPGCPCVTQGLLPALRALAADPVGSTPPGVVLATACPHGARAASPGTPPAPCSPRSPPGMRAPSAGWVCPPPRPVSPPRARHVGAAVHPGCTLPRLGDPPSSFAPSPALSVFSVSVASLAPVTRHRLTVHLPLEGFSSEGRKLF